MLDQDIIASSEKSQIRLVDLHHLMQLNTGELKAMMIQSYLKAAHLRRWLGHPLFPQVILECKFLLDWAYGNPDACKDLCEDVEENDALIPVNAVSTPVPQDLYKLTHQCNVVLYAHIRHVGRGYSCLLTHTGNSLIMLYPQGCLTLSPVPRSIKYIYLWQQW